MLQLENSHDLITIEQQSRRKMNTFGQLQIEIETFLCGGTAKKINETIGAFYFCHQRHQYNFKYYFRIFFSRHFVNHSTL